MMMPEAIENACVNAICTYDELNMKFSAVCKERDMLREELKRCVSELCLKCGRYADSHNGACNGCRWKKG